MSSNLTASGLKRPLKFIANQNKKWSVRCVFFIIFDFYFYKWLVTSANVKHFKSDRYQKEMPYNSSEKGSSKKHKPELTWSKIEKTRHVTRVCILRRKSRIFLNGIWRQLLNSSYFEKRILFTFEDWRNTCDVFASKKNGLTNYISPRIFLNGIWRQLLNRSCYVWEKNLIYSNRLVTRAYGYGELRNVTGKIDGYAYISCFVL